MGSKRAGRPGARTDPDAPTVEVTPPQCRYCDKKPQPIKIERRVYQSWLDGVPLHELMPDWDPDERLLLEHGTHRKCRTALARRTEKITRLLREGKIH